MLYTHVNGDYYSVLKHNHAYTSTIEINFASRELYSVYLGERRTLVKIPAGEESEAKAGRCQEI